MDYTVPQLPTPHTQTANGDKTATVSVDAQTHVVGLGSFHKSLAHNEYGEVDPKAFKAFLASIEGGKFEDVSPGTPDADALVNPLAARAREGLGPEPTACAMEPAPRFLSASAAAEMTELYWMALLRDKPFTELQNPANPEVVAAIADLQTMFGAGLTETTPGSLRRVRDLPASADQLNLNTQTLFRCGLFEEDLGPLVSQFFVHDIAYGTQTIVQKQKAYQTGRDYLTDYASWLAAQRSGRGLDHKGYADDNSGPDAFDVPPVVRPIGTMRDLARFVNKDALHQAYFNAALLLLNWKAPADAGNPYGRNYHRQKGFGTLGGPHLLSLVSEVASRALKAAWFQKWNVHLRGRPESYAGHMHIQHDGIRGDKRAYGLPASVFETTAAKKIRASEAGTWLLPMAFSAGSPVHPAYGAGHATVAGACVTVLKAWFAEDTRFSALTNNQVHPLTQNPVRIVQPGLSYTDLNDGTGGHELVSAKDVDLLTVGGELNKLASNVAMGRSMGGVHWRSDNTRSLRLGQQIATAILLKLVAEVAEEKFSLSYKSFDRFDISITKIAPHTARLTRNGAPADWMDIY
jgi:hypothetical protein